MSKIYRVTLFKLPKEEDINGVLPKYAALKDEAKKDGKPYILSASASRIHQDPRNQGFTVCATTSFASLDDMRYYDNEDEAHGAIKTYLKQRVEGPPLMVYMDKE
ncbi:hypothetical protein W97_06220 [Coniosporium apollinis CBS 100218]|uniref:Stress-response A/B barrel domain-containing protein n=1 Tax=Coniosporium apollinis (strain CBS 100218) TaxID=1168221 RepID=R7YY81_CONA1|nr:uncharacterized protein W97_06220 [Coniosporium apollinis CBS 100218]EON66818.1 hypothetical protein W97_06220 [Coniosporium apollinis CBS 100218]